MENVVDISFKELNFYKNKRVFVTGHTGFKGTWLCKILTMLGANVTGYSLQPQTDFNFPKIADIENKINSIEGDVRNFERLKLTFDEASPEIVFHLAAQPLVREGYKSPRYTYETNVMGTVDILECVRQTASVSSFLNVTTDKVYKNNEWEWAYRENEPLDGFDPYSNSKSCSELVTHSYKSSFFSVRKIAISTARAGNVIGGGDFSSDRIIPDCIRAAKMNKKIVVRNPASIRPYQHVLEPLYAYLTIAQKQYENVKHSGYYNVGPDECDCITTGELAELFCQKWGNNLSWASHERFEGPHEANFLKLDCSKLKSTFNWKSRWNIETAVEKTVEWTKSYFNGENVSAIMEKQIAEFLGCAP